jgi:glycosyltransferase involved in cell wall biosynthesis
LVVEAGAGLATPAEDAKALAETILQLYSLTPVERKNMGENGRQYFQKHFNHDHLVDQLIGHLQSVSQSDKEI